MTKLKSCEVPSQEERDVDRYIYLIADIELHHKALGDYYKRFKQR